MLSVSLNITIKCDSKLNMLQNMNLIVFPLLFRAVL